MKIRDLILYLLDFNLDAEVTTELEFAWTASDGADTLTSKMKTDKVIINFKKNKQELDK